MVSVRGTDREKRRLKFFIMFMSAGTRRRVLKWEK